MRGKKKKRLLSGCVPIRTGTISNNKNNDSQHGNNENSFNDISYHLIII